MSAISTILARLRAAIWAIDVRDDIANAIEQCYSDVSNPTLKTEALEAALQNKIDQGEMAALTIGDHTITAAKLANGVIPAADATLTETGKPADAAETGRQIGLIKADLGSQTGIISLLKDFYINTSTTPISLTPIASTAGRMCAVVDCVAGDKFVINAYSNSAQARAWCFIDSTNTALSMADELVTITDTEITAPTNASKLIINDMNGGMSYKVGNNLASKIGSGLSDDAKAALLECIRHIARWDDASGQAHYAALYEALYGVPLVTPVFHYVPADGLLSEQTGVTSTITTEATENIVNGKLRLFSERQRTSTGSEYARFVFGEYNETYGRIKTKAKLFATKYNISDSMSGSFRVEISNATHGAQFFVHRKSNGKITAKYVVESQSILVDTDFDANDYHTFEFIADGNTQKLIIDGTTVVNATGLSTSYVGGVRLWCISESNNNITLDIESIEYYEEA